MTVLSPTTPLLPHLVRIGAKLIDADLERMAVASRLATMKDPTAHDTLHRMREEARAWADRELEGAYSVQGEMAALVRALAEACAIEAPTTMGIGNRDLIDASWHLLEAVKRIQSAVNARANHAAATQRREIAA